MAGLNKLNRNELFLGLILETKDCKEPDIRDKTESCLMVYLPPSKDTGQPDRICATVAGSWSLEVIGPKL